MLIFVFSKKNSRLILDGLFFALHFLTKDPITRQLINGLVNENLILLRANNNARSLVCAIVIHFPVSIYSKTCVKRPLKNRQNKDLVWYGSLMKVESIAECSKGHNLTCIKR